MDNNTFPLTPADLTPAWLTACLRRCNVLAEDAAVTSVRFDYIGHGKMSANARLALQYRGDAGEAPASIVGKFPAEDARAREIAGAQGAYYKEVMFYRDLAPRTPMRTPRIYTSEVSADRKQFLLLMEDMAGAIAGDNTGSASLDQTRLAARQAARLAASFYDADWIAECDYILAPARTDGGAFGQVLLEQSWPGFLDRFGAEISPECRQFGEHYVTRHSHFVSRFQGPKTLIHGDFRSENILFSSDSATTVDWQTASESSPLADLAYFLGGSIESAQRRDCEREIVALFRDVLAEQGVELSVADCWAQYREYAMHGLMIVILGASFSSPEPRGDRMFQTMIRRHLQHCLDVGAGEFLD